MKKRAAGIAARFALTIASTFFLSACVTRAPYLPANLPAGAKTRVELESTPFFPQKKYQCGPAALATVLNASGAEATPDALVPLVYLPARHGSLQVEMEATPRWFGRLSYVLARDIDAIVAELDAGRPVLVLHNYGLPFLPRWHYAVVVGYDAGKDTLIMRSGVKRRREWRTRTFMVAWHNGGRWAMVTLRPGETPVSAEPALYLESAADFERAATPQDARLAFDAAVQRWPSEPVAWIGRGTAEYRQGRLTDAARDYAAALRLDGSHVGARNNLAQTLLDLKCPRAASKTLEPLHTATLQSPIREAVDDTRSSIAKAVQASAGDDPVSCAVVGRIGAIPYD
jgi:tetratricopeptide (TPR) repeat protein